jgi:hypothetical protein
MTDCLSNAGSTSQQHGFFEALFHSSSLLEAELGEIHALTFVDLG